MSSNNRERSGGSSGATRRTFIKQSSMATAGLALGSRFAFAAPLGRKVRIGVVGGNFGKGFYFHEHPNAIVEAVSDLRTDRRNILMQTYRCNKSYESLEKMVGDKNIDAIFIATPAPDHVRHVELVLDSGKHVMSAVPAAWGSLEECERLIAKVKSTGLKYMMAETSYYYPGTITARQFYREGKFGNLYSATAQYHHDGLEQLYVIDGKRTWRYGMTPMWYPTHCTSMLISVTGERLTSVSCQGWGDGNAYLKDNAYQNPFWNETAFFKTNKGTQFTVEVWWKGAHAGDERGEWYGDKMSLLCGDPNGVGPHPDRIVRAGTQLEKDSGGFVRTEGKVEAFATPNYWKSDLLPPGLRHDSDHRGSHTFLTHEFIDSIVKDRNPLIDVYEAVAYTAPGIVAHQSAMKGGELLAIPQYDPRR
jgi:predicted dehydrogenase